MDSEAIAVTQDEPAETPEDRQERIRLMQRQCVRAWRMYLLYRTNSEWIEFPDYAAAFYGLSPEAAKHWQDTGNVDTDLK